MAKLWGEKELHPFKGLRVVIEIRAYTSLSTGYL